MATPCLLRRSTTIAGREVVEERTVMLTQAEIRALTNCVGASCATNVAYVDQGLTKEQCYVIPVRSFRIL